MIQKEKNMNIRHMLLIMGLFFGFNGGVCATEDQTVPPQDPKAQVKKMTPMVQEELKEEAKKQEEQNPFVHPQKMLEKLPESCRKQVLSAWSESEKLFSKCKSPMAFLLEVAFETKEKLLNQESQAKEIDEAIKVLDRFLTFLQHPKNLFALQIGLVDEETEKSIQGISTGLIALKRSVVVNQDDAVKANVEMLGACFDGIKNRNMQVMIQHQQEYLKPFSEDVFVLLDAAQASMTEVNEQATEQEREELKDALEFWQGALQQFDTILKGCFQKDFLGKHVGTSYFDMIAKAAPFMISGYAFYRKFTTLYALDAAHKGELDFFSLENWKNRWYFFLADQTIRSVIAPVYFIKRFVEFRKNRMNPNMQQAALRQILHETLYIYSDPNFYARGWMWPLRVAYRFVPALAYHTIPKFGCLKDPAKAVELNRKAKDKYVTALMEEKKITKRAAVRKYNKAIKDKKIKEIEPCIESHTCELLRSAVWFSIADGYRTCSGMLEDAWQQYVSAQTFEKLERYSLGVVKPGIIDFAFDTVMPIATHKLCQSTFCDYLDLTRKDVFKNEYCDFGSVRDCILQKTCGGVWNYAGDFKKLVNDKTISDDEFYVRYIEGRIIGYLAQSFGSSAGKMVTSLGRGPIKAMLSTCHNGFFGILEAVGLKEEESRSFIQDVTDDLRKNLKDLFRNPNDPFTAMGRQMFLNMLFQFGVLKASDIARVEEEARNGTVSDEFSDNLSKKIVTTVTDNILIKAGGFVGSFVSWFLVNHMMQKHYPDGIAYPWMQS